MSADREEELTEKLLRRLHLSASERRELPSGRVRLSVILTVIALALRDTGWFPAPLDEGEGAALEKRADGVWAHHRSEVGVGRLGPLSSQRCDSPKDAARAYLEHAASGTDAIDGVPIDWSA